jgi:hypothetical protein
MGNAEGNLSGNLPAIEECKICKLIISGEKKATYKVKHYDS